MGEAKKRKVHTAEFKAKVGLEAVRGVQGGAQTALGVTVNSIMYRGVSFGTGPAAAWNTIRLAGALKAAGVPFHTTNSILP